MPKRIASHERTTEIRDRLAQPAADAKGSSRNRQENGPDRSEGAVRSHRRTAAAGRDSRPKSVASGAKPKASAGKPVRKVLRNAEATGDTRRAGRSRPAARPNAKATTSRPVNEGPPTGRDQSAAQPAPNTTTSVGSYRPPLLGKLTPLTLLPEQTKKWIRNGNDERAAQEGARFNQKRVDFAINWMQSHCFLYEGKGAGFPIEFMPWQYDFLARLYGWLKWSDDWGRWVRRFKQSCLWAPKKSGKSPFEAANGLYLCFAEGEPGMKCYSLAFDKKQALIAHTHAERMVEFSPTLSRACKINRSTHEIFHRKSFSSYTVVSGDRHDKKGASKEGFNGSILVDETHAVTFDLMRRVKRAGISRPEPLKFECSTAGPDLEGYGFGRYQLGHRLLKSDATGGHENPYFPYILHEEYMPPDGTSIEDYRDEDKVRKIIIATNPSIAPAGTPPDIRKKYILSEDEAMSDWKESVQTSEQELRDFAMYRTNLWLSSATSWIPMHVWHSAKRDYGKTPLEQMENLRGYPCFGGLDMSKVGDMTALSANFLVPLDEDAELAEKINKWSREKAVMRLKLMGKINDAETALENSLIERMQTQMQAEAVSLLPEDSTPGEADTFEGPAKNGMAMDGLSLVHDGTRYIIRTVHFFWIPLASARALEGYVDLFKWQHFINFIPEDVINYSDVSDHIEWLRSEYGMKVLAYDPNYADDVIRNLLNGTWFDRELLQVDQRLATMSPLSQDWERGIISQSLQHPGNAVLDWMNSHCELYRAASGLVKPVKPPFGNFRKIDGIVAGINALACLRHYGIANIINGYQFSTISESARDKLRSGNGWTADELGLSEADGPKSGIG